MAFPLKSGADLYNQQLIRAAIWNHGADPSETVTGLLYFNTSNSSAAKKLRLHTGTEWKTIAFEEDLDVANNAEFKALEDKVKLLSGEVDTDAIINNMKDVENFLAGFNESGGTLMNYLNPELGKKFDKLGGTISGTLKVSSSGSSVPFTVETTKSAYVAMIMRTNAGHNGHFIYAGDSTWRVSDAGWNHAYTLLHEGNVGGYALKIDGSNKMAERLYMNIYAIEWNLNNTVQLLTPYNANNYKLSYYDGSAWKTIAFTDSNVASATKLETPRTIWGQSFDGTGNVDGMITVSGFGALHRDDTALWVNYEGGDAEKNLCLCGNRIVFYSGKASNFNAALLINQQGNVTIGGSDLAGTSKKLYVSGEAAFASDVYIANGKSLLLAKDAEGIFIGDDSVFWHNAANIWTKTLMTFKENGNVGIGLTNSSAQLHVAQDIVANGTIACKGIAAEGDAMDMVDKTVLHIPSSTTQQTFTLNHGLGTREITVSIYETTTLGTNMILTDVEIVDDNNISVSFGNPPSENHMVVVMG